MREIIEICLLEIAEKNAFIFLLETAASECLIFFWIAFEVTTSQLKSDNDVVDSSVFT